ncbi:MAG: hypothetical protein ACXABO_16370 [Promethearchaeota archaeon]|jgi:phosphatidylglycerophosphate synthase
MISIGMMDNLDGILARLTNKKGPRGSYQDLIFDRINDGIILISPIFSHYTQISSILFLLFTVFIFENLRSIHISVEIPIFSTLSERHARLVFQIGYIIISSCGFYLTFLGYTPQAQIFGKNIYFWPNLDILYICLGFISIIGIVQLMLKISKTKISPLQLSNNKISIANSGEYKLNESITLYEETSREEFEEAFNNLVSATYLNEFKYNIKRLGYIQGKSLNRIIKNSKTLFLISLITDFMFFLILLLKLNLKPLNFIIETLLNVFIITYFLFFMGHLKRLLYYSAYKRYLSIPYLIFFHLLDLITEILLLSILAFSVPSNTSQIYVILCLIVQLCHIVNQLNQRRKVVKSKTYLSRTFFIIINLTALLGILFNFFIQELYFLSAFTLLLSFFLFRNIYKTNSLL